jgi:NADPH:quinone reductase
MTMMDAVVLDRFGGPDVLKLDRVAMPEPGPGQVRVKVHAAGINFADTLMRQDRYAVTPPLPSILGSEAAGVVDAVGEGVTGIVVGQRVAAPLFAAGQFFGGYAQYAVTGAEFAVPIPDHVSFDAAAALLAQGLSALYLTRQAPPSGKTVLVNAAAGGVGSLLVQLALLAGATCVIAAASTKDKLAFAREMGANITVNYTDADWADQVAEATGGLGPDIIYESAGGAITRTSLAMLAPKGQMVVYGALNIQDFALGVPELMAMIFKNQSLTGFALAPLLTAEGMKADLGWLFALLAKGALRVTIGGRFAFEAVADAHRQLESRATHGKLVLIGNAE